MSDENDKSELESEVGKLDKSLSDPAIPPDVKHLIENGMDQYFEMRNKELDIDKKKIIEGNKTERLKFSVKSAILVVLMAALVLLSVYGFLTTELAVALGIGIGVVFNIDVLGFIK